MQKRCVHDGEECLQIVNFYESKLPGLLSQEEVQQRRAGGQGAAGAGERARQGPGQEAGDAGGGQLRAAGLRRPDRRGPARDPAAGQEKKIGRTQGDRSRPLFGVERATEA